MPSDITAEGLRTVIDYNKETGVFVWKKGAVLHCFAGKVAGTYGKKGYRTIKLNQKRYQAHRSAWLYVYGAWPEMETLCGNSVPPPPMQAIVAANYTEDFASARETRAMPLLAGGGGA